MGDQTAQLKWSSSFAVASPSSSTAKKLEGDKILLPQSALEGLLSASTTTGPSTTHTFTAFDPFNPYSVAAAQQERARYTETFQQLPHPLIFRLTNERNGNTVFAGIREFSSDEGEMALSPYLMEALGIEEADIQERGGGEHGTESGVVDLTADDDDDDNNNNSGRTKAEDTRLRVTVQARRLPKGTYVRLRPLEAGYDPDDWKSLLERQLRASFTTLTKDSVLSVHGVKGEEFKFLVDKFEPGGNGICVVDTDLEVDIEALNEEQARETLRQMAAKAQRAPGTAGGSSAGQSIDIWKEVEGQVLEGDYVDYDLPSWDKSRAIAIELSVLDEGAGEEGTVDLFVSPKSARQRALPRDSEFVFGDLSSPKDGVKRMVIQPTNAELEDAQSILISVHGYSLPHQHALDPTPRRYKLRAQIATSLPPESAPSSSATPETDAVSASQHREQGEEQCRNCQQWIPQRTIVLHENFCRRNNILCPTCRNVFQKSSSEWADHWHCPTHADAYGSSATSKAKHEHVQHTPHTCPSPTCGPSSPFTFPSLPELARHRTTVCPGKLILCRFCHLEVPQEGDPQDPSSEAETVLSGLTAHERADGARTTDCHLCGAIVRLRDMAAHTAHHELDKAQRSRPVVCRDALCGRTLHGIGPRGQVNGGTRMGQGPGNELGLCSLCFAPLYVSMHDPDGKALRRRVERRYLGQLMAGCGKKWCQNEWCRTGRANSNLEPLLAGGGAPSAAAALPVVRPLLESVADHARPMHFCVDEASQRRRKTAEMLAAEGAWELEWCIAALEAEGGNLAKAREWLVDWAPTKAAR